MSKVLQKELAKELIDFLYKSPTAWHVVASLKKELDAAGYVELKESDIWDIKKGNKYYVVKNLSALVAFEVGSGNLQEEGFRLVGAHTDAPGFRIKPNPEMVRENKYVSLNTEIYGGPILHTWFDRPLALAGTVTLKGESPMKPIRKLVNINKPLMIIPSLAIHMNRTVNEGFKINAQKDTLPLLAVINEKLEKNEYLLNALAEELKVNKEEIITFDLGLYEYDKGSLVGLNEEMISSPRLDDVWMVFCGLKALLNSDENKATKVLVCIDNEEIGNKTQQGANSSFLANLLERITLSLGMSREDFFRTMANSIMISSDLSHAVHPNSGDKHDPTNRPLLEGGPVLKIAASGSYSTDGYNGAIFESICKEAKVPYQVFVNRSDVRGGTTIGPISATLLSIPVIDMGAPVLGMHSIRELATVADNDYTIKAFKTFLEK